MKQFLKILKFELLGYLKNKVFVGITIFLVFAIAISMFIPNIIAFFQTTEQEVDPDKLPKMVITSNSEELSATIQAYFTEAFTDYNVTTSTSTLDEIKSDIIDNKINCAFVMEDNFSYTYYVNNLSINDTNTLVANEILQEVYRLNTISNSSDLTPEQTAQILAFQVEGQTETLGKDQAKNFFYTYIMIFALYMVILLYGQMVATNVASEKSSKAMEVLVTSAKPTSMMFGKVSASCIIGLGQLIAVFGSALLFYNINKSAWGTNILIQSIFNIPLDLFIYLLVFFVLGFLIYAFMYGAIGSTATKLEDVNTSIMPITFLFIIAFFIIIFSMTSGSIDNVAMVVCSYIPFTSPMAMFTRIAMSSVAWYEILISIVILILSTIGIGFLSAKIYRVGVLHYGESSKLSNILKSVFTKSKTIKKE